MELIKTIGAFILGIIVVTIVSGMLFIILFSFIGLGFSVGVSSWKKGICIAHNHRWSSLNEICS